MKILIMTFNVTEDKKLEIGVQDFSDVNVNMDEVNVCNVYKKYLNKFNSVVLKKTKKL